MSRIAHIAEGNSAVGYVWKCLICIFGGTETETPIHIPRNARAQRLRFIHISYQGPHCTKQDNKNAVHFFLNKTRCGFNGILCLRKMAIKVRFTAIPRLWNTRVVLLPIAPRLVHEPYCLWISRYHIVDLYSRSLCDANPCLQDYHPSEDSL